MGDFFVICFLSSVLSFIFLISFRGLCLRFNLFKSQKGIPYIGGMGLSLSFILTYLFYVLRRKPELPFELIWLITFSFIVLAVELLDDLKDFSLRTRIIIQLLLVFLFLLYGKRIQIYFLPGWLNYLFSFLWIMGVTHAFNHLDIADGLCGGIALIISLSFLWISFICREFSLVYLYLSLSASLLIFLFFNIPPASLYMGNSGSHFLGFMLASLSMYGDYATLTHTIKLPITKLALFVPIFILAVPIFDTLFLIFIRLRKGILPVKKSDDHIFLLFRSSGYSTEKALCALYSFTLIWCLVGIFIVMGKNLVSLFLLVLALAEAIFIISRALPKIEFGS
ncbi:MAG: undecaprenyl/decaprenyl-phosphate alpha-N-acetylglucosaminyl 1-phosphate transferase [Candidatus Omnitrophica bacterium]|nr:undecaprenyl/decaprenyl-phosphate alpha-N-acetylglucosaminyl 1-phosphate transferase [Candidatus Omnitrophota bacterium]